MVRKGTRTPDFSAHIEHLEDRRVMSADVITSVPPQFLPNDPTLANYVKVWDSLPIANYFLNSTTVAIATADRTRRPRGVSPKSISLSRPMSGVSGGWSS